VFGTSLAYLLFFKLLARVGATRSTLVTYVTPFSAVILGAVFLGERLPLRAFAAMVLIFLSIALSSGCWTACACGPRQTRVVPEWMVRRSCGISS